MQFHEKLQKMRKQKGMTQDELAQRLYVSRTAVSKWESGKGYPNIESLKQIAKFFCVTVDELLSGEELLSAAEQDQKEKDGYFRNLVFGLLDVSAALLLILPLFGQRVNGRLLEVSLLALSGLASYQLAVYYALVISMIILGVIILCFHNYQKVLWLRCKYPLSIILNCMGVLLFISGMHPYPAALLFFFATIKAALLIKWH